MQALNITPDGSMPKNPYDLHRYDFFTSKLGQFLPVGCVETVPDGIYDLSVDAMTLTFPCNTWALSDFKENYYFLYVPYSQLFNSAYGFFPQRKDNQSALDYSIDQVPWFPLGTVVHRCIQLAKNGTTLADDVHGFNGGYNALRLLDMLGYGCYLDFCQAYVNDDIGDDALAQLRDKLNTYKPNVLRIAAYQKSWYCYFRNRQYDTNIDPKCFNFDDVVYHVTGVADDYNILNHRSVDHFIRDCLAMRYVPYKKDLFTASMPGTQYGAVSSIGLSAGQSFSVTGSVSGNTGTDVARWTKQGGFYESSDLDESDLKSIKSYNVVGNTAVDSEITQPGTLQAVGRQWDSEDGIFDYGLYTIGHNHSFSANLTGGSGSISSGATLFDVLQLVEAQAIQKWKQKSMLAGQRAQDQYRAHYGVVPRHLEDHYPDFIGSVDNIVHIDKVVNQSNTMAADDKNNLGDLGGRGYGASDTKHFRFHSSEHGVILLCRAVVPENLYSSFGLDRANQLIHYSDFWQPEFQNIGLQAVPKILLDIAVDPLHESQSEHEHDASQYSMSDMVLGYAPMNYQLKQYHSKVHGMFNPPRTGITYTQSGWNPYGFSEIQAFAMPRLDLVSTVGIFASGGKNYFSFSDIIYSLSRFYVNPKQANSTFAMDADSEESTDVFVTKCRLCCDAVQPLTPLGLPQF